MSEEAGANQATASTVGVDGIEVEDLPILALDDHPEVVEALRRSLRRQPWQLVGTTDPNHAIELIDAQEFAVVVSDYEMPGIDGLVVLTHARARAPHTQRILLSARAREEALERGINDANIHHMLRKPWRFDTLVSVLSQAVEQNRLRREHEILVERMRNRNAELSYLNQLLSDRVQEGDRAIVRFRHRWDAALDAIPDPIIVVGRNLRLEGANSAAAALADRGTQQLEGRRCHEALFGSHQPCVGCPLDSGAGGTVVSQSGREKIFESRAFALPGVGDANLCVYRDITEEVAFEREAAQMEKMAAVGRLAGSVAHELNNPLHAIMSFTQLAQQKTTPPRKLDRYHQIIRESAIRCSEIVRSLGDFSRREVAHEQVVVDLDDACERALVLFETVRRTRIERGGSRCRDALCWGIPNQLHQVFINLIQNAVDASPDDGLVRVSVAADDREVVIAVEDDGAGIPAAEREMVFEPFYTTKPEGVGTGLGLAISHRIIHEHGGTLLVSTADLGGARLEARLPRVDPST